jgi:hypothetical protein
MYIYIAERVPLKILPPTIPRNQEDISKESAIVDSQKSFASLFGSKVELTSIYVLTL